MLARSHLSTYLAWIRALFVHCRKAVCIGFYSREDSVSAPDYVEESFPPQVIVYR